MHVYTLVHSLVDSMLGGLGSYGIVIEGRFGLGWRAGTAATADKQQLVSGIHP